MEKEEMRKMEFCLRVMFFVLAVSVWGRVPKVVREFSAGAVTPEGSVRVELHVTFPEGEALPAAWVLTEGWPEGWVLEEATWEGRSFDPVILPTRQYVRCWLFGVEGAPKPGDGTLAYLLSAPANISQSDTYNTADGAVYTYNDSHYTEGVQTLKQDVSETLPYLDLTLSPGWSLMALPYELTASGQALLKELCDTRFDVLPEVAPYQQAAVPGVGKPFWLYYPGEEELSLELPAVPMDDLPEPLQPVAELRHRQWNLFGVCGNDPVRLAAGIEAWRWVEGRYERCEENAVLQPSEAVWLFVE